MNARDRGNLLMRLADLMEEHKEELATIESIGSPVLYTVNKLKGQFEYW